MRLLFAFAAALGSAAHGVGQQRTPAFGSVSGADGAPIAGAIVQFAWVPLGHEAEPAADAPSVVTDEHGRFRVDLHDDAAYRVWAIGPVGDDGLRPVSGVQWTWASRQLELRADVRLRPFRGQVRDWNTLGVARVQLRPDEVALPSLALPVAADGTVGPMPVPAPGAHAAYAYVDLLAADGELLETAAVLQTMHTPWATGVNPDARTVLEFVAADEGGAALAGVEVLQQMPRGAVNPPNCCAAGLPLPVRTAWRRLGATGRDGTLSAMVVGGPGRPAPRSTNFHGVAFQARRQGFATIVTTPFELPPQHWQVDGAAQPIALPKAAPFTIRARRGERPLAGLAATVRAQVDALAGWQSPQSVPLSWSCTTAADGSCSIADLPRSAHRVAVELAMPGEPPIVLHDRWLTPDERELAIDVGQCRRVAVQLRDDGGTPLTDAMLVLVDVDHREVFDCLAARLVPDRAGRCVLHLERGAWLLFAANAERAGWQRLDGVPPETIVVPMAKLGRASGQLVDAEGKARPGGLRLERHVLAPGADPALADLASQWNEPRINTCLSGPDGRFELPFLDVPGVTVLVHGHALNRKSAPFALRDEPLSITLQ